MKKIFLMFVLIFTCITPQSYGDLDPRVKTVSTLALYGTVGGGLLGAATMAYGTSSRAIFKGASLGLYAGLLFGSYILLTHQYSQHEDRPSETYPVDSGGPYQEEDGSGGGDYSSALEQRWQPEEIGQRWTQQHLKGKHLSPVFAFPLWHFRF